MNIGNALRFSNRTEVEICLKPDSTRLEGELGSSYDWCYCIAAHMIGYETVMIASNYSWHAKNSSGLKRGQVELTVVEILLTTQKPSVRVFNCAH